MCSRAIAVMFERMSEKGRRLRSHANEGRVGWYNAKLLPTVLPNWSIATHRGSSTAVIPDAVTGVNWHSPDEVEPYL